MAYALTKIKKEVSPLNGIFLSALLVTIYFNTQIYDSFNLAKFLVLLLTSSWLVAYLYKQNKFFQKLQISNREEKFFNFLISGFIISLILSTLFSYNKRVAFLGESFRRNGLLTYICLIIFFLVAKRYINSENISNSFKFFNITLFIVVTYAFIQIAGKDWVNWSSKQVFSTLGNTNFSGAVMSILALVIFGQMFMSEINLFYRILLILLFILTLFAIYKTNARQALILMSIGLLSFITFFAWQKKKKFGVILSFLSLTAITLGIFGAFNFGPLKTYIYKDSISVRGFYWRAGLKMFRENPWFGVGLDNYNYFFKQFREPNYSIRYGFDITSSNAHNVVIQNFATGGIFVGIFYVAIQLYILYKAIFLLKNSSPNKKLINLTVVVAWMAYQAQSIISIDNIGISIWGYILGGSIIGLSTGSKQLSNETPIKRSDSNKIDSIRVLTSSITLGISLLVVIPSYKVDHALWVARSTSAPGNVQRQALFKLNSEQVLQSPFALTDYKNVIFSSMIENQDVKTVISKIEEQQKLDPRNLDTLNLLIFCEEKLLNYQNAINYRLKVTTLDPWNAKNLLGLAQLYKVTGEKAQMEFWAKRILTFAAKDPIADVAQKEFLNSSVK